MSDKASGQTVQLLNGQAAPLKKADPVAEAIDSAKMSPAGRLARLAAIGQLDAAIEQARKSGSGFNALIADSGSGGSGSKDGGTGHAGGQAELSIAVDASGQHVVVGASDTRGFNLNPVSMSGYAYSDDGGATWVDGGTLPVSTATSMIGTTVLPQLFGSPEVKYLGGSNFIYFSIMVKKFSETQVVQTMSFHRSTDYGHTWTGPFEVTSATNPHGLLTSSGAPRDAADKEYADVDPETGRVIMSWNNFTTSSPGQELSTTYSDNIMDAVPAWSDRVVVSAVSGDRNAIIPRFAGGGSNEAYVAWPRSGSGGSSMQFARSTDNGATWSAPANVSGTPAPVDQIPGNDRFSMFPGLAVDNSGGPNQGHLYLVYVTNQNQDGADIAFQSSTDAGRTFSSPILLNSRPGEDRAQWFPWVAVDKNTGRVYVSYYDQGIAPTGDLTEATYLFSDDAGGIWSKPAPLTDRPFHAGDGNAAGQPKPGEYNQAVAQNGHLYAVWAGASDLEPSNDSRPAAAGMTVPDIHFKRISGGRASLRLGSASFAGSSDNGLAGTGEPVNLTLPLDNYVTNSLSRAPISGISASLSSTTPGVSILEAGSAYPNLAPGASAANSTPYVITLAPSFVPGTPIDLALTVTSSESPTTLLYTLAPPSPDVNTGLLSKNLVGVAPGNLSTGQIPSQGGTTADKATGTQAELEASRIPGIVRAGQDRLFATIDVTSVLNWAGRQGAFPIAYRGWGYAGYNGDGTRSSQPIDETAFEFKPEQFPQTSTEPSGYEDPNYKDVSKGNAFVFLPARVAIRNSANQVVDTLLAWTGMKDNILGAANLMRASRRGADTPSLGIAPGTGVQAVRRVGVTAPDLSLTAGIGPASVSAGAAPSFGLLDYMDLNGDGFPDIVAPGYVKYTNPRGGFVAADGAGVSIVNQETTISVSGGAESGGISIKANAKGKTNSPQSGKSAAKSHYGFNVGGSIGISASFTNPPGSPVALEQSLADVNGDGLPDRVRVTDRGVLVRLNLGYRFADPEILWAAGGGFESNESYSGSVGGSFGFTTFNRDFSAGLGLTESIDVPRYAWIDVDGDGILDRLRKDNTIKVAFGTNSGLMEEVNYGTVAEGTFELIGGGIPIGQQISLGRSRGVGAGFDFTIGVGPLCIAACYLIVNPGVHFDHTISSTQIQLTDVDGDGYPDSVKSTADNQIMVRFNNRGRTNLLRQVRNPLGGSIRLGYSRDGNTEGQPNSVWTLSSVEVDDGRPGDGVDVRLSTYEYSGGRYNRLEREMLGYSTVIERQRAFAGDGNVADDPVLRVIERNYLNNNIFDSGLLARQTLRTASGTPLQETQSTWSLIDLASKAPADLAPNPGDPAGMRLLTMAVAPLQTKVAQRWFDSGGAVGKETWITYQYDGLGNVVRQVDVGEPDVAGDDVIANIEYTTCSNASAGYEHAPGEEPVYEPGTFACPATPPAGGAPPYWHPNVCPTWTSLPAHLTITDGSGAVLRQRDGAPALCDNSSVTDLKEWFGPRAGDFAESFLSYDSWGSYNHIDYPENAAGQRLTVDYVYDDNSHAGIASTTDSHGLTATATFDGPTGRLAERTDANGQKTSYTYDAFGRLATITGPYQQGTGTPTMRFEYHTDASGYAYAIARHFDVRHPGDTIDTVTFVDGIGRQTQTKQDGTVFRGATLAPANVMLVSSALEFDALGRTVRTRYPVTEPLGTIGTYNTNATGLATTIEWDLLDRQTRTVIPDGSTTITTYDFGGAADFGANLFRTAVIDPLGKPQTSWIDVHNNIYAVDDEAVGQPRIRTRYSYDPLGQLTRVTDNAGNVTTHAYDLMGRGIATQTPDGGLVETRWDGASNIVAKITPNLRKSNQQINYRYDIDRLIAVDYPDTTPDVTYTYGGTAHRGTRPGGLRRSRTGSAPSS